MTDAPKPKTFQEIVRQRNEWADELRAAGFHSYRGKNEIVWYKPGDSDGMTMFAALNRMREIQESTS